MEQIAKKKTMGKDFTKGNVMKLLFVFFLPFLLANLLNSLYNTVDTVIIGQFVGSSGTVAVSLGGKLLNLYTNISIAIAGGGQVLIAQQIGANKKEEMNRTIGTLFTEMFIVSLILAVITLILSKQIIIWLNTPEESADQALAYLRITSFGLPLVFGYNAISSVLRGMGDSKSPLLFIAIAAVINLIGDLVFIVVFNMGAAGTAYATIIGQGCSLIFSVFLLYKKKNQFGFDFKLSSFKIEKDKLSVISKIGFPMALRSCCITITQLVLMSFVNTYGLVEAAAYAIGDKIVHLTNIFDTSTKSAAGSMIAQNIGADKPDRVKKIVNSSFIITMSTTALLIALSLLIPNEIFRLFTKDTDVIALSRQFMNIACIIFLLSGIMSPLDSVVTGTGQALLSLLGGILDGVVFRILFSILFANVLEMGVPGFFLADALARTGPIIIGAIYYYGGFWKKAKKLVKVEDS